MAQTFTRAFPDFVPVRHVGEVTPSTYLDLRDGEFYRLHENVMIGTATMRRILLLPAQTESRP